METGSDSQTNEERLRSRGGQEKEALRDEAETARERSSNISQNELYVRDRALNRANNERIGEKTRPDPYEVKKESVGVASKRDVSPNTPKGEPL